MRGGGGKHRHPFPRLLHLSLCCNAGSPFTPNQRVIVNQGTGVGVRGKCMEPYWALVKKTEGDTAWVVKGSTKRVCKVPLWCLQETTQWEATPISVNSRPTFRRMSAHAKAKIVAGADANLRGNLAEAEKKMMWIQRKCNTTVRREKQRAARALDKMKSKCAIDVRTAELVELSDCNYWRKRALAAESRAEQAGRKVKRMKSLEVKMDDARSKLEIEQQKKRDIAKKLKRKSRLLVSARLDCDAAAAKYDELVDEVEASTLEVNDTESQTLRLRDGSKGTPITREFETVARSCMATGMSADACRQTLRVAGDFFLGKDIANKLEWPQETWYRYQREAAGNVAWLLVMVEVAGATRILQHGCDETGVSGVGTFSQWVLLCDAHGKTKIRVFECAGLLPGSTTEYITEHIKET